ncbi:hypothetical protein FRB90_005622, partial [Tulasnella sp. 427]
IKWLEALVIGLKSVTDPKAVGEATHPQDLFQHAEEVQIKLHDAIENNDSCRKFIKNYNQYAHLLSPAAAISPVGSAEVPTYDAMPDQEFETLLAELEPDIRAADRDLLEIDDLDHKGVSAAGKLPEHEALKGRLQALELASQQDLEMYDQIEARISRVLQSYASHVTILSELFVSWNDLLGEAEDRVEQLETAKEESELITF